LRAGLATPTDTVPMALALALALLAESTAVYLARPEQRELPIPEGAKAVELAGEHLRDVLDLAQIYIARPDSADRLARALHTIERRGGPEVVSNLAYLTMFPGLGRLVRSQVITLLGLLASPSALDALIALLGDMDALIRSAVHQAFVLAGTFALAPLQ